MNQVSCDGCGVVFDRDKLKYPVIRKKWELGIREEKAAWVNGEWVPAAKCIICGGKIPEKVEQ